MPLDDIALDPARSPLTLEGAAPQPVRVDAIDPEAIDGDPENDLVGAATPNAGATREAWDQAVTSGALRRTVVR